MSFFAIYPPSAAASSAVQTVQGEGTPGSQMGGLLTVQGDPSGTPIPISGNITAASPSVGPTGSAVPADADYAGMNVSGTLTGMTGTINGLNVVVNAAIPAGSNIIGKFGIDQTTPGTTNAVQLTAGSAIVGKVSIDQTTPGTTNGVQVNAALPAGTNLMGKVGIDQTTPGTTNGVQVNAALPAGTNLMGKVGIDQTTPGTTNAIQATSGTTIAWQAEGNIAAGSVTGSYQTVFTPSASTKVLFMRNNTDASITVSMDAGTTANFILDSGDQVAIDFVANGLVSTTSAIQVKQTSGAPTTGSFRINGGH